MFVCIARTLLSVATVPAPSIYVIAAAIFVKFLKLSRTSTLDHTSKCDEGENVSWPWQAQIT
eukprot:365126-Chlamydomonas_euryale.AAC.34